MKCFSMNISSLYDYGESRNALSGKYLEGNGKVNWMPFLSLLDRVLFIIEIIYIKVDNDRYSCLLMSYNFAI